MNGNPSTSGLFDELDENINRSIKMAQEATSCALKSTGSWSSRVSSRSSIADDVPKIQVSHNMGQWTRLQSLCQAINGTKEEVAQLQAELQGGSFDGCLETRDLASQIQNSQVIITSKRAQVEELKRRLSKKRIAMLTVAEERAARSLRENRLQMDVHESENKVTVKKELVEKRKKHRDVLVKLVVHRRQSMITDLGNIYHIELDTDPNGNSVVPKSSRFTCACVAMDLICGIHLPPAVAILGHSEILLGSAYGHVVNVLRCLSFILGTPLRYPVKFSGSASSILEPKDNKIYPLYGNRTRVERERLDTAVTRLNQNIAQLRSECGFATPHPNKTLSMLKEFMDWLIQKYPLPRRENRAFQTAISIASTLGPLPPFVPDEEVVALEQRFIRTLDVSSLSDAVEISRDRTRSRLSSIGVEAGLCEDLNSSVISANTMMSSRIIKD